jgi:hypothetical protein
MNFPHFGFDLFDFRLRRFVRRRISITATPGEPKGGHRDRKQQTPYDGVEKLAVSLHKISTSTREQLWVIIHSYGL